MRDGADAAAAPPGGLRVGGDADLAAEHRAGDVRGVAVAGLHAMVVVPGGHEDDRLAVRGPEHARRVGRDQRAPREDAEIDRLEVREERVVALDRHHRLPRLDRVAVVQRGDLERVPVVGAELEHGDRLVHPAEHRRVALEDLHQDARVAAVGEQRRARVVEVRVGVVALPHLLDGEVEDVGVEALAAHARRCADASRPRRSSAVEAGGERRPRRPRAAPPTARPSRRVCRSWPGRARARETGWSGCRPIQPKISTAAPTAPTAPSARAAGRAEAGARGERARGRARQRAAGRRDAPPQRSCSFVAGSPVS